jgi:hypothetical protein
MAPPAIPTLPARFEYVLFIVGAYLIVFVSGNKWVLFLGFGLFFASLPLIGINPLAYIFLDDYAASSEVEDYRRTYYILFAFLYFAVMVLTAWVFII